MRTFYDPIEPYDVGRLPVSPLHTLYYEQSGNPGGQAGGLPARRAGRRHDAGLPTLLRPRGLPHRALRPARLRARARPTPAWRRTRPGIWSPTSSACGRTSASSAGSSSAARGAARWRSPTPRRTPSAVSALVLRGIFLCRQRGDRLVLPGAAPTPSSPTSGRSTSRLIPEDERGDMMRAYYRRLTSGDEAVRLAAARAWSIWEGSTSKLYPDAELIADFGAPEKARGAGAHRVPLLHEPRASSTRRISSSTNVGEDPAHPGGHRPGALRHGLPDDERVGAAPRLARGRAARHSRRRPLGARARDHRRARRGHRPLPRMREHG